ncbi:MULTISPECIES: helix-turn-helix transcriptional regulator [unclassified Leucobacter]|uniref:helix-turn-helix transcriptional regulator n=1 Tax=unclassified Leucobacter TaxID=2621730 RepID=UPI003016B81D
MSKSRKREIDMIGRKQELALAIELITSGLSVDLVGTRNSGRSAFLRQLRRRFEDLEWRVLTVRGVASLRPYPLAALHMAGLGSPSSRGNATSLRETTVELIDQVREARSVLLIDDWDDLDESSWGVVETVRRATGVPTVSARLQGMRARHTPSGLAASTFEPSYVIELAPLSFEDMEQVVVEFLGGPIDISTMTSVFVRSGGNTGLALTLLEICRREDRIVQQDNGEWIGTAELWSPRLRAVMEAYLELLDDELRDAIEMISLVGLSDVETVRKLVPWEALEVLEEQSLITTVTSSGHQLVAVVPQLLAEFLRHEPVGARRLRLTATISERLDSAESRSIQHMIPTVFPDPLQQDALFIRLLQEQSQTRVAVAATEWERDRDPHSAVRYIRALSQVHADTGVIDKVLEQTEEAGASHADRAHLASYRAKWMAYVHRDIDGMRDYIEKCKQELGDYGRLLDATEVRVLCNVQGIPADFAARLELTPNLPRASQTALLHTQLMVLTSLGRFEDALRVYGELESIDRGTSEEYTHHSFKSLALIGIGQFDDALRDLARGLDEARGDLELEAAYTFGTGVALCHLLSGDYDPIDAILDTFAATGDPLPFVPGVSLMLANIGAVVAVRRGHIELGHHYVDTLESRGLPDGAFPGQSLSWAKAQIQAFNGDLVGAQATLWDSAEQLWRRGSRFAAAIGFLGAIELRPERELLELVRERLAEIDGAYVPAYQCYVEALIEEDPELMMTSYERTRAVGLDGIAVSSLRSASTWFRHRSAIERAEQAERLEQEFTATAGRSSLDTVRFGATAISLTDREREVAALATKGLSNQEIATQLVLSVRTVETHMHRIMRKIGVTTRQALGRYIK